MAKRTTPRANSKTLPMALGNRRTEEIRHAVQTLGPRASAAKVTANLLAKGIKVSASDVSAVKRADAARHKVASRRRTSGAKRRPASGAQQPKQSSTKGSSGTRRKRLTTADDAATPKRRSAAKPKSATARRTTTSGPGRPVLRGLRMPHA